MPLRNLAALWAQADTIDQKEGRLAYQRYHATLQAFALHYGFPMDEVTSAFVALSPNNDYHGNLRSLASVLHGKANGVPLDRIVVSTYNACRNRAHSYLDGAVSFLDTVKGPKTRAFRDNILRPDTSPLVTVDGHMVNAWHGVNLTMVEASRLLKNMTAYRHIAADITELAVLHDVAPCQAQAVLWYTRKRLLGIKYTAQLALFSEPDNAHRALCAPEEYPPYEPRKQESDLVSI